MRAMWRHSALLCIPTTRIQAVRKYVVDSTHYVNKCRLRDQGDALSAELDTENLQNLQYLYTDTLGQAPGFALRRAIDGYLAPVSDNINKIASWMQLGHQHAYFRPVLYKDMICSDGTDAKFLPGPENIWKYRLWAGGSVVRHTEFPVTYSEKAHVNLFERAPDIRVIRHEEKPSKVFVTIKRTFGLNVEGLSKQKQLNHYVDFFNNNGPKDTPDHAIMTETEHICFLREPPASLKDDRRVKPPSNPTFSHTMIPSWVLLFQFSALTYNAHKIHFDREFAQQVYGAKDLIVHGPLTQVLMIEFLIRFLGDQSDNHSIKAIPKSIQYTNLLPLYVDQPLTLCCKPTLEFANFPSKEVTSWQVWIQKESSEGPSCAVKAIVDVQAVSMGEYSAPRIGSRLNAK